MSNQARSDWLVFSATSRTNQFNRIVSGTETPGQPFLFKKGKLLDDPVALRSFSMLVLRFKRKAVPAWVFSYCVADKKGWASIRYRLSLSAIRLIFLAWLRSSHDVVTLLPRNWRKGYFPKMLSTLALNGNFHRTFLSEGQRCEPPYPSRHGRGRDYRGLDPDRSLPPVSPGGETDPGMSSDFPFGAGFLDSDEED
jgi:hypothetical protein